MTVLKINDNSIVPKIKFKNVSGIINLIANKTLGELESEGIFVFPDLVKNAQDITSEQIVLQEINENYCSSNVMGFLGYKDERLVIESRFTTCKHDYFFQYLLERVLDFPNILNLNTDMNRENRLFNWFIFLFPYYLKSAMRKGIYKTYICHEYNDSNVRGVIDVARHFRQNFPFIGQVAYSQREFSYDNDLMELVRHTVEYIKTKPYGNNLLRKVKDQVNLVISLTNNYEYHNRLKVIIKNKNNPVKHAYYHEYRSLQLLCLMILQHKKHQIGSGTNQIHGILIDGAWLWEEYMNTLISSYFYHPMNKNRKGAQELFSTDVRKEGLIYPDFLSKEIENRTIADAKYKPIGNIGNKDYLQVLAYMFRFGAKYGFYLYPETNINETGITKLIINSGSTYENNVQPRNDIMVTKLGLKIPYVETEKNSEYNYKDFKNDMISEEKIFLNKLLLK